MISAIKSITHYPIVQIGWSVFGDLETAVARWVETTGAGPFFYYEHVPLENVVYRGKAGQFDHTSVVSQWCGVQLELMLQHDDEPSHIREMCPDGKPRLCSVSWMAPSIEDEIRRMEALGFPIVWSCAFMGKPRGVVWFDTRSIFGCFVEVFEHDRVLLTSFAQCAKAAEDWNGERPLRPIQELLAIQI